MEPSGFIKIIALRSIASSTKGHTGYSLMNIISEKCGKRPSAGSIYPILQGLHKEGLVSMRSAAGDKKFYIVTEKGKEYLAQIQKQRANFLDKVQKSMKYASAVLGGKDNSDIILLMERLKKDDAPFKDLTHDMIMLRKEIFRIAMSDLDADGRARIKKIIHETVEKLRKVEKKKSHKLNLFS